MAPAPITLILRLTQLTAAVIISDWDFTAALIPLDQIAWGVSEYPQALSTTVTSRILKCQHTQAIVVLLVVCK